jgi:Domain of unknown function (DUF2382)
MRRPRGLAIMDQSHPIDIQERVARWRQEGWQRFDPQAAPYTEAETRREREPSMRHATAAGAGETAIPVVEEEVTVGKREVERGRVRIRTYTEEHPVEKLTFRTLLPGSVRIFREVSLSTRGLATENPSRACL